MAGLVVIKQGANDTGIGALDSKATLTYIAATINARETSSTA